MRNSSKFLVFFLLTLFVAACDKDPEPDPNNGEDPPPVTVTKYTVGSYYDVNGIKGVVYEITSDDSLHGKIISLDEAFLAWCTTDSLIATGALDVGDGEVNMTTVKNLGTMSDFPAFEWCQAKNSNGVTGWYLPAVNEVYDFVILVRDPLNETLAKNQGTPLQNNAYWSSTEFSSAGMAMIADARSTANNNAGKKTQHYVRAVRKF
ncbi:MAG: DUF1566 domain-containing protein [Bacteroidales bacterium]|jgi:hypothetical protein|nr:DUF1566 domain-containing protein [Bacteroidales bacterium]